MTSIGEGAFEGCSGLESVTVWATTPPTLGEHAFNYFVFSSFSYPILPNLTAIKVPSAAVSAYQAATNWSSYSGKISDIPNTLTANQISSEYWCTYYNGYSNADVDENTTVYTVSVSGTTATLHEIADGNIKAGEAVVLKSTANEITLTYNTTATTGDFSGNELKGVDEATTTTAYTTAHAGAQVFYTLANADGLGFFKYTGSTLGANKAFLALDAEVGASARGFVFSFEEESTGIESLTTAPSEGESYYSLSGQRVLKPTKGLYIHNGKKIFVRWLVDCLKFIVSLKFKEDNNMKKNYIAPQAQMRTIAAHHMICGSNSLGISSSTTTSSQWSREVGGGWDDEE